MRPSRSPLPDPAALRADLGRFREALKAAILGGTTEERKEILKEFVRRVEIKAKGLRIVYGIPETKVIDVTKEKGSGKEMFTRAVNSWLPWGKSWEKLFRGSSISTSGLPAKIARISEAGIQRCA